MIFDCTLKHLLKTETYQLFAKTNQRKLSNSKNIQNFNIIFVIISQDAVISNIFQKNKYKI